ncbi:MAG: Rid family hydrolase [Minwuiales bacterium]|nr:Rid family hydrolase [Minwuiales bacterium]
MRFPKTALAVGALSIMTAIAPTAPAAQQAAADTVVVNPPGLFDPAPNGFSHAVVVRGGGGVAYIAGQGGEDRAGKLPPTFDGQVKQAYANLRTALAAVGAEPGQVARITTYVVGYDQSMLEVMTRHVRETFGDALPAQTLEHHPITWNRVCDPCDRVKML